MAEQQSNVRKMRIGNNILITTEYGTWVLLDQKEYSLFSKKKLDNYPELKKKLEESLVLLNSKNQADATIALQRRYEYLSNGASLHIIVPTLRCNHKCLYCHSKSRGENESGYDMDAETAKKTVDFILQTPSNSVVVEFQGGEPLLNFETVRQTIEYFKEANKKAKKNYRFDIVTNLTKMDHDILKYLIREKVGICTSLDGPAEVHNKNRSYLGGNSYDEVVHWIKEIREDYSYHVDALMVTTKYSLPYYKEIIDEYIKQQMYWIKIRPIDRLGFADETWSKIGYTAEEYIGYWKKSMEYLSEVNKKYPLTDRMVEYMLAKLNGDWVNYVDLESPCGAVIGQMAYDYDGNIYTCDEGRQFKKFNIGNVKSSSYNSVLASPNSKEIISASLNTNLLTCDSCAYSPFCGICPVCCYAEYGDLRPRLHRDSRCKINKATFTYLIENLTNPGDMQIMLKRWMKNCSHLSTPRFN